MDERELNIYKTIGKINTTILKANSYDDAIKEILNIILDSGSFDYGVIWYVDDYKNPTLLKPFYSVCPLDIKERIYKIEEGMVGKSYNRKKTVTAHNFNSERDVVTFNIFKGIDVSSILCVPFYSKDKELGCIELIKTKQSGVITVEEAEICEVYLKLTEIFSEDAKLFKK